MTESDHEIKLSDDEFGQAIDDTLQAPALPEDRTLLILDDDRPFLTRLTRAMELRGFTVTACESVEIGRAHV